MAFQGRLYRANAEGWARSVAVLLYFFCRSTRAQGDLTINCENEWRSGDMVTVECLLKRSSYPSLCVAGYGYDNLQIRHRRVGQSSLTWVCRIFDIQTLTCSPVSNPGPSFCGCVSKNASYWRILYVAEASYATSGQYSCRVDRCDDAIFNHALSLSDSSCGSKLGNPHTLSLSLFLPSLSILLSLPSFSSRLMFA